MISFIINQRYESGGFAHYWAENKKNNAIVAVARLAINHLHKDNEGGDHHFKSTKDFFNINTKIFVALEVAEGQELEYYKATIQAFKWKNEKLCAVVKNIKGFERVTKKTVPIELVELRS